MFYKKGHTIIYWQLRQCLGRSETKNMFCKTFQHILVFRDACWLFLTQFLRSRTIFLQKIKIFCGFFCPANPLFWTYGWIKTYFRTSNDVRISRPNLFVLRKVHRPLIATGWQQLILIAPVIIGISGWALRKCLFTWPLLCAISWELGFTVGKVVFR